MLEAREIPNFNPQAVLGKIDFQDGCWEWQGHITRYGYGTYGKQNYMAHRVVYELLVDKLGPEDSIDHLCLNKRCVNARHMEVVPLIENVFRNNSPTSVNHRKTECKNGHEFDEVNTYIHPTRGTRHCKQCQLNAQKRFRSKIRRQQSGN